MQYGPRLSVCPTKQIIHVRHNIMPFGFLFVISIVLVHRHKAASITNTISGHIQHMLYFSQMNKPQVILVSVT